MLFASIYCKNPRNNSWNFLRKKLRIGGVENLSFLSWPFWIKWEKETNKQAKSPWKSVNIYRVARMGQNFDDYPGFQPKTTPVQRYATQCIYIFWLTMNPLQGDRGNHYAVKIYLQFNTWTIDTGHFFNVSLAQCLVF